MIQRKKLGEIANISAGQGAPQGAENYSEEGTPFVKAGDLFYLVNGERECDIQKVSEEVAKNHRLKLYPKGTVLFAKSGMSCMKGYVYATNAECYVVSHLACIMPFDVDSKYLKYYFEYHKPNQLVKDASYPSISLADIAEMPINVFDDQTEAKIVDNLDAVNSLIAKSKEELGLLDNIVKSRFVEMFGLPGTDVHGWGMSSLGEICEINPKKSQDARLTNGLLVSFVPMPSVSESGDIDATQVKPYDEVKTGFTYFAENDVLFAKITPCMENGKGAIATGLYNGIGFGSTEFHVLRPAKETATPRWIYTLTVFPQFRIDAASNMTGSAGQRRVPASFLENYRVSVPPLELQNRFAAFVTEVDKSKLSYEMEVAA